MEITVVRKWLTQKSTIGELSIDGKFECFTLEDVTLEVCQDPHKIDVAIPEGRYEVIIDFSDRFQRLMPHILDVPDYDGIRFHQGNTDKDTIGCLLLGISRGEDFIGGSHLAFEPFFEKLQEALKIEKCYVTITQQEIPHELA